jgi:hypothetical protein
LLQIKTKPCKVAQDHRAFPRQRRDSRIADRIRVRTSPNTGTGGQRTVNRDRATRWARPCGVQFDVGELGSINPNGRGGLKVGHGCASVRPTRQTAKPSGEPS